MSSSSNISTKLLYSVGVGLGVTALSGATYWYYKYLKQDVMPEKWRRVGTLEQINLFPVKSCAPLRLNAGAEVTCEVLGLRYEHFRDRALMIVNDENQMITARVYPKMVLIETKIVGPKQLVFSAPNMDTTLELDFARLAAEAPGKDIHTSVWGSKLDAMLCGEKYDKWLSKCILGKESGLHLVHYPYPKPVRTTNSRLVKEPFILQEDSGTFGDATSYMLMNLASIEDLNTRIPRPVNPLQFRGNFHLKMDAVEPYAEDNWGWIRIGDEAVFRIVAPCTRCIFPNINVSTAERDPDGEPLKTLKKYRMFKNYASPALGIHLGIRQQGNVKVNDVIYVEDK